MRAVPYLALSNFPICCLYDNLVLLSLLELCGFQPCGQSLKPNPHQLMKEPPFLAVAALMFKVQHDAFFVFVNLWILVFSISLVVSGHPYKVPLFIYFVFYSTIIYCCRCICIERGLFINGNELKDSKLSLGEGTTQYDVFLSSPLSLQDVYYS